MLPWWKHYSVHIPPPSFWISTFRALLTLRYQTVKNIYTEIAMKMRPTKPLHCSQCRSPMAIQILENGGIDLWDSCTGSS